MVIPPLSRVSSLPNTGFVVLLSPPNGVKCAEDHCLWKGAFLPCTRLTDLPRIRSPRSRWKRPISPERFLELTENAQMRKVKSSAHLHDRLRRNSTPLRTMRRTWSGLDTQLERANYERFSDPPQPKDKKWQRWWKGSVCGNGRTMLPELSEYLFDILEKTFPHKCIIPKDVSATFFNIHKTSFTNPFNWRSLFLAFFFDRFAYLIKARNTGGMPVRGTRAHLTRVRH